MSSNKRGKPLLLNDDFTYTVKETIWDNGERFAFTEGPDGLGAYWPVLYAVTRLRSPGHSSGTMIGKARVIAQFHIWAERSGIDLLERLQGLRFFRPFEIEGLRQSLRSAGVGSRRGDATVSPAVWITRCRIVARYIEWHAGFGIQKLDRVDVSFQEARERLQDCQKWLVADLPKPVPVSREGLDEQQQAALLRAIVPGSAANPFPAKYQFRNFVLVLLYYQLGLRLSEALALKTTDLRLEGPTPRLFVVRRADDPADTRQRQPLVKTKARPLPVAKALARVLWDWIIKDRKDKKIYGKASRSEYVFVSRRGVGLSKSSAEAIFRTLRTCEGVPGNMSAHPLRHTWNDRFSRLADDAELREAVEKQLRNFLMGWKETSEQGASYARRATQEEADRLMLTMQNDLVPEA